MNGYQRYIHTALKEYAKSERTERDWQWLESCVDSVHGDDWFLCGDDYECPAIHLLGYDSPVEGGWVKFYGYTVAEGLGWHDDRLWSEN